MNKIIITPRIRNLAREVDALSKHAMRCVVEAVKAEQHGRIEDALKLFDKQAAAEKRIKELLAMPSVCAVLAEMGANTTPSVTDGRRR